MKVAQMLTTIPDAVPADFAAELAKLQSQAPPMGASFVRRRMQAELGPNWRERFAEFDLKPAAAASLGQVHKATSLSGERLACKLQYPDMASAVETDLSNLDLLFSLHRRASAAIDTREIASRNPRAGARRTRLPARGQGRTALPGDARRPAVRARAPGRGEPVDAATADDAMARRRATRRLRDRAAGSARRHRRRPVRRVVAPVPALWRHSRRSASRQLYGRRVRRPRKPQHRRRQSVRLRLRAHLPAAVRARRGRALSGAGGGRQGAHRPGL